MARHQTDTVSSSATLPVTGKGVDAALGSKSIDKYGTFGLLGGANLSSKSTWTDLIHEVSGSNYGGGICGGSINTAADKGLPAGWYNFLYIPHRTGRGRDSYMYGTLLIFPMTTNASNFYIIHHVNGNVFNAIAK